MKITIDLLGATQEQRVKFDVTKLPETLSILRSAVGDDSAEVVVSWGPSHIRTVHHVVQSAKDFPAGCVEELVGHIKPVP